MADSSSIPPYAPLVVSTIAVTISCIGAGFSIFFGLRDRARLILKCCLYHPYEPNDHFSIGVTAINAGRRPVALRTLGGFYKSESSPKEHWSGSYIASGSGLPLGENGIFEKTISTCDSDTWSFLLSGDEQEYHLVCIGFEDTVGRRYVIKNSRSVVARYWAEERKRIAAKRNQIN